jgi:hypothetical protein
LVSHTVARTKRRVWFNCYQPKQTWHTIKIWFWCCQIGQTKTNECPRNLKRANEWYSIKKGTATPLNQVIARGAGAQLNFWRQRMNGADIADVYYPLL